MRLRQVRRPLPDKDPRNGAHMAGGPAPTLASRPAPLPSRRVPGRVELERRSALPQPHPVICLSVRPSVCLQDDTTVAGAKMLRSRQPGFFFNFNTF